MSMSIYGVGQAGTRLQSWAWVFGVFLDKECSSFLVLHGEVVR
jgi:hypothetical protein